MKRTSLWALGLFMLLGVSGAFLAGGGIHLPVLSGWKAPEEHLINEPGTVVLTLWSDKVELFLEYPRLVAGQASTFAVHLTDLRSFQPVTTGPVEIRMTAAGKPEAIFVAPAPIRPGIFTPSVMMAEPGNYEMEVSLMSEALTETFRIPQVQVFFSEAEFDRQTGESPALVSHETVTFLKEQQWKSEFATNVALQRSLASTLRARGIITSKMGQEVVMTAPATGRVLVSPSTQLPIIGQQVKKGEILVAIAPGFSTASRAELESAVSQAALQHNQARRELIRTRRLYEEKILAKKQVEQANTAFLLAKHKYVEAQKRLAALTLAQQRGGTDARDQSQDFLLRAPIDGMIVKADLTPGARAEAGDEVFTLINLDQVWLEAHVFAADIPHIYPHARAAFQPHGMKGLILPEQVNSRLVTIGSVVDPGTNTLPVIFEVDNPGHRLKVGMHADVFIETGEQIEGVVIAPTAVLYEDGKKVAYVQTGGETFEKRFITTGLTTGLQEEDVIQVREGIQAGERVVTKGAYAIKLAAASGDIPTHAH